MNYSQAIISCIVSANDSISANLQSEEAVCSVELQSLATIVHEIHETKRDVMLAVGTLLR